MVNLQILLFGKVNCFKEKNNFYDEHPLIVEELALLLEKDIAISYKCS